MTRSRCKDTNKVTKIDYGGSPGRKLDRTMIRSCKDPNNIAKKNDYEGSSGNMTGRKTRDCVDTSKCSRDNTSRNRVMPILKSRMKCVNRYWNFNALVGPFFPAVTGITTGSNRSDSSKDTHRSIPKGTLATTLTTTMYLNSVFLFGCTATREKLYTDKNAIMRDKIATICYLLMMTWDLNLSD
nr:cation-chloride cotransporter 1-like isoform X2 [Tanacetum cinerariifolium]